MSRACTAWHGACANRVCSAKMLAFRCRGGAGSSRVAAIGFVPPKSAQARRGGNGNPVVTSTPRGGAGAQGIECLDGRLAPRQRAPLIAVEPHQARRDVVRPEPLGHDLQAHAADAQHIHLRLGDAERGDGVRLACALAGDPPRQLGGVGRERRVGEHRHVQPVAQRIARHRGLAGAAARPGAARRIGAVGGAEFFTDAPRLRSLSPLLQRGEGWGEGRSPRILWLLLSDSDCALARTRKPGR